MRIKHVDIEDFRLLRQLAIWLEEGTTLIVGRNDYGKIAVYLNPKRSAGKQTMVQQ